MKWMVLLVMLGLSGWLVAGSFGRAAGTNISKEFVIGYKEFIDGIGKNSSFGALNASTPDSLNVTKKEVSPIPVIEPTTGNTSVTSTTSSSTTFTNENTTTTTASSISNFTSSTTTTLEPNTTTTNSSMDSTTTSSTAEPNITTSTESFVTTSSTAAPNVTSSTESSTTTSTSDVPSTSPSTPNSTKATSTVVPKVTIKNKTTESPHLPIPVSYPGKDTTDNSDDEGGLSVTIILVIAIGVVIFFAIVAVIICLINKWVTKRKEEAPKQTPSQIESRQSDEAFPQKQGNIHARPPRPLAPDHIRADKFKHKGALVLQTKPPEEVPLIHELDNDNPPSIHASDKIEFDSKLNEVYDMGSEVETMLYGSKEKPKRFRSSVPSPYANAGPKPQSAPRPSSSGTQVSRRKNKLSEAQKDKAIRE